MYLHNTSNHFKIDIYYTIDPGIFGGYINLYYYKYKNSPYEFFVFYIK